ncbi:hypothetical protein FRB96_006287 [Tulasnella sp. 330]|nr:hypothetical protein FRB96_006287 [Tulasnella sp. 330]KAG8890607.1 hypothetical protein FRB98_007162 [Tulasnella sp. 332]
MSLLLDSLWAVSFALLLLMSHMPTISCTTQFRRSPQTAAQCGSDFEWMFNAQGQSPCLIAAYLQGACFDDDSWTINALGPGESYMPPDIGSINACQCNTVTYNALSACAACQDSYWVDFKEWIGSCPAGSVLVGKYPFNIPTGTVVPAWASLDTSSGTFDVNAALKVASNGTMPAMPTKSRSRLGSAAIAGIAIGALFFIGLLIALFYASRHVSFLSLNTHGVDKVKPAHLRTLLLGDGDHQYVAIQKPPRQSPFLFFFKRRVSSEPPTAAFMIDNEAAITDTAASTAPEPTLVDTVKDAKARSWHHRKLSSQWLLGGLHSPSHDAYASKEGAGSAADLSTAPSRRESQGTVSEVYDSPLIGRIDPYFQSQSQTSEYPPRRASGHAMDPLHLPHPLTLDSNIVRPSKSAGNLHGGAVQTPQLESSVEYPTRRSSGHSDIFIPSLRSSTLDTHVQSVRASISTGNLQMAVQPSQGARPTHSRSSTTDTKIVRQASMQSVQEGKPLHIPRRASQDAQTVYVSEPVATLASTQADDLPMSERQIRERRRMQSEVSRRKQSSETCESVPEVEGVIAAEVETTPSETHSRAYSPPIHRSRLQQLPTTAPAMMYPAGVRGTLRRSARAIESTGQKAGLKK